MAWTPIQQRLIDDARRFFVGHTLEAVGALVIPGSLSSFHQERHRWGSLGRNPSWRRPTDAGVGLHERWAKPGQYSHSRRRARGRHHVATRHSGRRARGRSPDV